MAKIDNLWRLLSFSIFCVSLVIFPTYGQDICVKKSSCICEFSNGTGIDLTPTAKSTFYTAQNYYAQPNGSQYELSTYFYHPCYNIIPSVNTTTKNTCTVPLSICRHVTTMKLLNTSAMTYQMDSGTYDYMGTSNLSQFSADGRSIIYTNGPSSTTVLLVCAQNSDELHINSLEEPDKIVLSFYSKDACLKQIDEVGRSLGSTLLIILFSFVIFYLVLGICTKKFLMGATGIEVIPNLGFWSDLPNLVRDGWAFAINGFKLPARGAAPVTTPDPNSYDSI